MEEDGTCSARGRSSEMHTQALGPGTEVPWLPLKSFGFSLKEWGVIGAGGWFDPNRF